jgi:peptidoglycan hydrolase-like protein with peptidoglycan-binding domain
MRTFILGMAVVLGLSVTPTFAAQGSDRTRAAQQALKDKGFDPGPIDGVDGPKTDAAVREYQEKNNLVVDGRLNDQVLDSLGLHGKTAGGHFDKAGNAVSTDYSKGGHDIKKGAEKLTKDVKTKEIGNAPVDFGKNVGKGAAKIGKGTGKAAVDTVKGVKEAVTPK